MAPPAKLIHPTFSPQARPKRPRVAGLMFTPKSEPVVFAYAEPFAGVPSPRLIHPMFSHQINPDKNVGWPWAPWPPAGEPASCQFIHPQFSFHDHLSVGEMLDCARAG